LSSKTIFSDESAEAVRAYLAKEEPKFE